MFEKQCKIKMMINKILRPIQQVQGEQTQDKTGFTLVELLVVMSIVAALAIIMLGAFDPFGMVNRGRDSLRKKDLNRIKIALEEYFNDKGTYPMDINTWNIKSNCGKNIPEFPDLKPWPCDPNGNPYIIVVYPTRFKVLTNLENKKDKDIPNDWYVAENFINTGGYSNNDVNYGVSSTNISWYDLDIPANCAFYPENHSLDVCNKDTINGGCNAAVEDKDCTLTSGITCYAYAGGCDQRCKVPCCGDGCQ